MKIVLKVLGVIVGILLLLIVLFVANEKYPFRADNPNFSHVEAAFNKLEFPSDWQKKEESENRGRSGRACDAFNDSGCFHKRYRFNVKDVIEARNQVRDLFLKQPGCTNVTAEQINEGNSSDSPLTAANIECITPQGLTYYSSSSLIDGDISVGVSTY